MDPKQKIQKMDRFYFKLDAIMEGPVDLLRTHLVARPAFVNWKLNGGDTPLHLACMLYRTEIVDELLQHGADVCIGNRKGLKPIHYACKRERTDVVKLLLEARPESVNLLDNKRTSPLHIACSDYNASPALVELLLNYGARVNITHKDGFYPIHMACVHQNTEVVKLLLEERPKSVNSLDKKRRSPLHIVCSEHYVHHTLVELLLSFGARDDITDVKGSYPIHYASKYRKTAVIKLLVEARPESVHLLDRKGRSPLHIACSKYDDSHAIEELLLTFGARFDITDENGFYPIHYACECKRTDLVKLLLEARPESVNWVDKNGSSPLHIACSGLYISHALVELLLSSGARVDITDENGFYPIHCACEHSDELKLLLEARPDSINWVDKKGRSPLHILCCREYISHSNTTVEHLLSYDARVDITDEKGFYPIHYACEHKHTDVVKLLLKARPQLVDCVDNNGRSPLHITCSKPNTSHSLVELLLSFGARVDITDEDGSYPIHYACESEQTDDVVKLLLEARPESVNWVDRKGKSPFLIVCSTRKVRRTLLSLMLSYDANVDITDGSYPIHYACNGIDTEDAVKLLLEVRPESVNWLDREGRSPLLIACAQYYVRQTLLKLLLSYDASVDMTDKSGSYPIHYACNGIDTEDAVKLLLEVRPESVNWLDREGRSPLLIACAQHYANQKLLKLLLSYDASVDITYKSGHVPIHESCHLEKLNTVRWLLEHYPDSVNQTDYVGKTPLHIAFETNNMDLVGILLDYGASTDSMDKNGLYPIHYACKYELTDSVKRLLQSRPESVNLVDNEGRSPLHIACSCPNDGLQLVKILLSYGANVEMTDNNGDAPIHTACRKKRCGIVELLLDHSQDSVRKKSRFGKTPLQIAMEEKDNELVEMLLGRGASTEFVDFHGDVPINRACSLKKLNIVRWLLGHYPESVNQKDYFGITPLHIACETNSVELVTILLDSGASTESKDNNGLYPIHYACQNEQADVVKLLLQSRPESANLVDNKGRSPMHIVCSKRIVSQRLVEMLLSFEARADMADEKGLYPIHYLCEDEYTDVVKLLLQYAPESVNLIDDKGRSPLHIACSNDSQGLMTILLRYGACVDMTDRNGKTPIQVLNRITMNRWQSSVSQDIDIVNILLGRGAFTSFVDINWLYALHYACKHDYVDFVKLWLQFRPESVNLVDNEGRSPLHVACSKVYVSQRLVDVLLSYSARVDITDEYGKTILDTITVSGNEIIIRLLLAHFVGRIGFLPKAEVFFISVQNKRFTNTLIQEATKLGENMLNLACKYFSPNMVLLILKQARLLLHVSDSKGIYPIHLAAARGDVQILKAMIARGADVTINTNIKKNTALSIAHWQNRKLCADVLRNATIVSHTLDANGNTLLHLALQNQDDLDLVSKVKQLISWDPTQLNRKNRNGYMPLHLAVILKDTELIQMIMLHSNVNSVTRHGYSALQIACYFQNESAVRILLTHPMLDINAKSHTGDTAAHISCREKNMPIVKTLQEHSTFLANCRNAQGQFPSHIWSLYGNLTDLISYSTLHIKLENLQEGQYGSTLKMVKLGAYILILFSKGYCVYDYELELIGFSMYTDHSAGLQVYFDVAEWRSTHAIFAKSNGLHTLSVAHKPPLPEETCVVEGHFVAVTCSTFQIFALKDELPANVINVYNFVGEQLYQIPLFDIKLCAPVSMIYLKQGLLVSAAFCMYLLDPDTNTAYSDMAKAFKVYSDQSVINLFHADDSGTVLGAESYDKRLVVFQPTKSSNSFREWVESKTIGHVHITGTHNEPILGAVYIPGRLYVLYKNEIFMYCTQARKPSLNRILSPIDKSRLKLRLLTALEHICLLKRLSGSLFI